MPGCPMNEEPDIQMVMNKYPEYVFCAIGRILS